MSDISDDAKSLGGGVGSDGTGAGYLSTRAGQEALDELLAKEKPLQQWQEMRQAGTLTADDIVQYFKRATPYLFNLDSARCDADLGKHLFNEYGAKRAIIDLIEEFVCCGNVPAFLDRLKSEEHSKSTVCGRMFKNGEPTYCCRECGMDPTCVLCVNCFKQSSHRHHKYKMNTSSGGGCCDCGDPEAWKRDPYCDQHKPCGCAGDGNGDGSSGGMDYEDSTSDGLITEEVRKSAEILFTAILKYSVFALEMDANATLVNSDEDIYCTVLYNDETHVLEQVIQNLMKTIKCNHKDAVDYTTRIDREGRAVVKCTTFEVCDKLKTDIEKQSMRPLVQAKTSPLRVGILHKITVSYQQFAIQVLAWLQDFLKQHKALRAIFTDVITDAQNEDFNVKHIMRNDHKLWKTARAAWHRLLITGMLMEYENKKRLATIFIQSYTTIMQDFIRDDHEHSYSIVSLSVQLFTVPTIAHYLIAQQSAFFALMHTFYAESVEKYVQRKVLQFAKNVANFTIFKRASYILFDVRYLLHIRPDVWTDELRKGFLQGISLLIKLLKVMQGMDAVHRQTGSHIDYEPEWESAFNLHIKLANVITAVLDWCSTDKVVLVKTYRMVLAALAESEFIVSQGKREVQELADHSASCLMYDVALKNVSVHLPLSRFFAGLYLHLEKFDLSYDTVSSATATKPGPEAIIEPVLCTQTMVAQVHAGLWRRNGYSLLNQLYFYGNVKCRSEMLDRDIIILQIGASLIESNEYMIHLVNKFNLMNWANANYEEEDANNVTTVVNMVDEFLELLLVIVGERYVPGVGCVTEEDRVKKELIQQLCIKPYSHSELNRALPHEQHEAEMENVFDQIAVFKKPQLTDKKGVYELRPEYYAEYNMYFYHYSKEEKSKSEEAQRKRQQKNGNNACCLPPKLPKLTESFSMIANLLQCDVMFLLVTTVIKRACDLKASMFAESHLQKVLYLLGYGIQESESGHYPFLTFYDRAVKWQIPQLLAECLKSPRVETQTSFVQWVLDKFNELKPKDAAAESSSNVVDVTTAAAEGESEDTTTDKSMSCSLAKKKQMAAERQAKIMAQMMSAQKKFMSVNAELFDKQQQSEEEMTTSGIFGSAGGGGEMDWEPTHSIACLGPERKIVFEEDRREKCILCSEEETVCLNQAVLVYSCFVQTSNVLYTPGATPSNNKQNLPHVSSCGHVMHATCWLEYFQNERAKETRRPHRNRSPGSFDIDKKEFLCPLCRCLSNSVLPLAQAIPRVYLAAANEEVSAVLRDPSSAATVIEFGQWLEIMRAYVKNSAQVDSLQFANGPESDATVIGLRDFQKLCPPISRTLSDEVLKEYILIYTNSVQSLFMTHSMDYVYAWRACMYTVQSIEMLLRATKKPLKGQLSLRQSNCLTGLVRVSGLLGLCMKEAERRALVRDHLKRYALYGGPSTQSILEANVFEQFVVTLFMTPAVIYAPKSENSTGGSGNGSGNSDNNSVGAACYLDLISGEGDLVEVGQQPETLTTPVEFGLEFLEDGAEEEDAPMMVLPVEVAGGECGLASGQMMDYYNLKLAFVLNMVKIIIIYNPLEEQEQDSVPDEDMMAVGETWGEERTQKQQQQQPQLPNLLTFYQNHNIYAERIAQPVTSQELVLEVQHKSSTFLRSACILFSFVTGVEMPDEFASLDGETFDKMCEYLGLSTCLESYFQCESTLQFITSVAMHQDVIDLRKAIQREASTVRCDEPSTSTSTSSSGKAKLVIKSTVTQARIRAIQPCYLPVRRLIQLPDDYSELINGVSLFTCQNNDLDDSRNPTMCLICGAILCSQTYCCQYEVGKSTIGGCTYHATTCGNNVGPFLRIRECEILLLGVFKGCFVLPPYLDQYGETDQGLRRGNPLTLCRERYNKLQLMWLGHGLHEEISRSIEASSNAGSTQWQLL